MEVAALITDLELLKYRERQKEAKLDAFLDAYVPGGSAQSLQDGDKSLEPSRSQSDAASHVLPEEHERVHVHVASEHQQPRTEHQGYFGEKLNMVIDAGAIACKGWGVDRQS